MAGTWKLERRKDTAKLRVEPFAPFPAHAQAIRAAAEAVARFAEPEAEVGVRVGS